MKMAGEDTGASRVPEGVIVKEAAEEGATALRTAELETLITTSRDLKRQLELNDCEGVDAVLKEMLKFVNEIKEDPDLLDPDTAATVIKDEGTIITLASILDAYVKTHGKFHSACEGVNGHQMPSNLMRAVRVAQIVAEVAKIEVMREVCVDCGIIPPLIAALDFRSKGELIRTHACRAIGNICFDCPLARKAVEGQGGLNKLIGLMKEFQKEGEDFTFSMDDISKLRRMMTGCLLNLTNTTARLQDRGLEMGVVPLLHTYLSRFSGDEDLVQTLLLCMGGFAESPRGLEIFSDVKVASLLPPLLSSFSDDPEMVESVLELLAQLAEHDYIKLELASDTDCSRHLIRIVRETIESPSFDEEADEDLRLQGKLAVDLLVALVTGDAAMECLYNDGQGAVLEESLRWLSSSNEAVQTAGALALGNFARNDSNCQSLVSRGVPEKLMGLLRTTPLDKSEGLQHAVLSTLRNLAIPLENKAILLDKGILGTVLPLSKSPTSQIQFKLLGLIRMLVDNQPGAAMALGKNSVFVQLVVKWSENENPGIAAEAVRLLAWLIKNSRSKEVMDIVVVRGGFPYLVGMIGSEYPVMQNEALIAITLVFTHLPESQLVDLTDSLAAKLDLVLTKECEKRRRMMKMLMRLQKRKV